VYRVVELSLHWVTRSHYRLGLHHDWLLHRSCQLLLLHRVHYWLLHLPHRHHHRLSHWHFLGDHGHYTCDLSIARSARESHRAVVHRTGGTHFNSICGDLGLLNVRRLHDWLVHRSCQLLLLQRLASCRKTSRVVLDIMLASVAPFAIRS
jgi:hypothetical protein